MSTLRGTAMSFFNELKRRNVFRVAIAYLVVAWLVLQVADVVINNIGAPDWVFQVIMLVLALGFPLVLVFAWAFEMTAEGLKKEKNVDRSQSITNKTGRKLDFTIIGVMAIALGYFVWESRFQDIEATSTNNVIPANAVIHSVSTNDEIEINKNSIAVLPFANRSNLEEDLFFTDGIHDDLLTQLAKISDLRVISRTSVMEYRDTTKKIKEIAAELGVGKILEGGIQRAGKRIRVNAQLIDVATDEHLWAETFDREMTVENIFDIQSEITRHIVTAVRGELSVAENEALAQRPTDKLDAYEAYLKAKMFLNDPLYSPEKYINAEVWLKRAVASDPGFALAWSLLVVTNGQAIWQAYDETPERFQAALDALNNAEKYGPDLPETLGARAEYLYRIKNDFHAAEALFAQASAAKPGDSDLLSSLAITERRTGHFEQAITHFQMAIDLDPANIDARNVLLVTLVLMGAFERAEPLADLWIKKYPATQTFKVNKAQILMFAKGEVAAAQALLADLEPNLGAGYTYISIYGFMFERNYQGLIDHLTRPPLSSWLDNEAYQSWLFELLGSAYRYMGDAANAEKYTTAAIEAGNNYLSTSGANEHFNLVWLAKAYANARQFDQALAVANQAVELIPESADILQGTAGSINRAMILGMAGQREESLLEIERLLNTTAGLTRWELYLSPDWDFFRDDERFNELARPPNLKVPEQ